MGKQKVDDEIKSVHDKAVSEAATMKRSLRNDTDEVSRLRKEAQQQYGRFTKVYNAAISKRDGVAVKHQKVAHLAEEATTHASQISKDLTRSDNNAARIKELLASSKSKDASISAIHAQAQIVSDEINNTYAITLDTSLAGTLVERRNALKRRAQTWEIAYLISIAAIVVTVIIALTINPPSNFLDAITERLVFVTPLVVISFVISRQFGHERKLYEEYAFKAAAAQSLRGYAVLLNDQFKDVDRGRRDVLDFTLEAMRNIYDREPLQQSPSFFHFKFANGPTSIEAKIDERIEKKVPDMVTEKISETLPQSNT